MKPEPVPGLSAIVQSVAISDTQMSVQILTSVPLTAVQFQTFCMLGSDYVVVEEEEEEEEEEEKNKKRPFLIDASSSCRERV